MKNMILAASAIAAGIVLYSPLVSYAASSQAEHLQNLEVSEQLESAPAQENVIVKHHDQTEELAKNSNGRRCRWVPGHGLVCDGGSFGTFTL